MSGPKVEVVPLPRATHGEGCIAGADPSVVLWCDSVQNDVEESGQVRMFDIKTGTEAALQFDSFVGTAVPAAGGGICVTTNKEGFALVPRLPYAGGAASPTELRSFGRAWASRARPVPLCPDPRLGFVPANMNDGKCDPHGRLFAGTEATGANEGQPLGHLFRLAPDDEAATVVLDGISCSNGIVWTADRTRML